MEKIQQGPFRATRLWNMVATSFRQIPVGVHWKNMRKYEDTFTSCEAVDWMLEYLKHNPNFGEEKCTRNVCVKILDRLLQHNAFESVRGDKTIKFKEGSSQLFRFAPPPRPLDTPPRPLDTPLRPLSTLNGQQSGKTAAETTTKISVDKIWLEEFNILLAKYLHLDSVADLDLPSNTLTDTDTGRDTDTDTGIDVINIKTNLNENSVKNEDVFPAFVSSAIEALERWPDPPPGVPSTPGFERCLLFVVEGFLRGLAQPLIGCVTADLLRKCFELLSPPLDRRQSSNFDSSSSVESFMQDILLGGGAGGVGGAGGDRRGSYADSVCLETAFAGSVGGARGVGGGGGRAGDRRGSYPDSVCLETAFAGILPETRLIRKRPRSNSLFPTTDFMVDGDKSAGDINGRSGSAECIVPKSSSDSVVREMGSLGMPASLVDSGSASLERINPGFRDVINPGFRDVTGGIFFNSDDHFFVEEEFFTPEGKLPQPRLDWHDFKLPTVTSSRGGVTSSRGVVTSVVDLISAFQLVFLSEKAKKRRQLRCFLQMLEKIVKNNQLNFSDEFSTQDFVTHCFTPLILGDNDSTALRIMIFLVLNQKAIFTPPGEKHFTPPGEELKRRVSERLKSLGMTSPHIVTSSYPMTSSYPVTSSFSQRISQKEYEEQKDGQTGHMTELLNGIVTNVTMNIKEKRKKLKQFQKSYPEIYSARFQNSNSEESIFAACSEKPKPRLTKFKSLRL